MQDTRERPQNWVGEASEHSADLTVSGNPTRALEPGPPRRQRHPGPLLLHAQPRWGLTALTGEALGPLHSLGLNVVS